MNIVESIFNSNSLFLDATFHIMYTCTTAHFGPIKVGFVLYSSAYHIWHQFDKFFFCVFPSCPMTPLSRSGRVIWGMYRELLTWAIMPCTPPAGTWISLNTAPSGPSTICVTQRTLPWVSPLSIWGKRWASL